MPETFNNPKLTAAQSELSSSSEENSELASKGGPFSASSKGGTTSLTLLIARAEPVNMWHRLPGRRTLNRFPGVPDSDLESQAESGENADSFGEISLGDDIESFERTGEVGSG